MQQQQQQGGKKIFSVRGGIFSSNFSVSLVSCSVFFFNKGLLPSIATLIGYSVPICFCLVLPNSFELSVFLCSHLWELNLSREVTTGNLYKLRGFRI